MTTTNPARFCRALPLLLLLAATPLLADIRLPAIFSDHAVLQKTARVPVWGWADPGEAVTVTLDAATAHAVTGADGKWRVDLDLHAEAPGPFPLLFEGKNKITVADVLVGQVWVCSGQSNMELPLIRAIGFEQESALPPNPLLRQFLVTKTMSPKPLDDDKGTWTVAGPTTVGQFTAVGYFFGKKLQQELNEPVGLINSTFGGTSVEPWTSSQGLDQDPELKETKDAQLAAQAAFPAAQKDYQEKFTAWTQANGRQDHAPADPQAFAAPGASLDGWKPVTLPGSLAEQGFPAGAVWIRHQVPVSASPPKALRIGYQLSLGNIHGFETVYWNGVRIALKDDTSPGLNLWRRVGVPLEQLDLGKEATLAIRIYNPVGDAAIDIVNAPLNADGRPFLGPWLAKSEYAFPTPLPADAVASYPRPPDDPEQPKLTATELFNTMVNPLIPYAISGVTWYQGEQNTSRAARYRIAFPLMIRDWRQHWGQGDFPFYFCQLPNFGGKRTIPSESTWAELRESQAAALKLPNTGMAVLIDIGEESNLHPRDKRDGGERLARIALAQSYGKTVPFSGPVFDSMQVAGDHLTLHFTHTDGGLVAQPLPATFAPLSYEPQNTVPLVRNSPNSQLEGFQICGDDKKWAWADAKIESDGATVTVSSAAVPTPLNVRYAWCDNPTCNLYNGAGLPAAPFRTDDFPLLTAAKKFGMK
jgi:sialate O-acetylesterase